MKANEIWKGKGNGSAQKIRIFTVRGGRVAFERIEGSAPESLNKRQVTDQANIEAAFEYAGETMDTFL